MEIMIKLYKAYVLPHFDYCYRLLLGIGKCLNNKLEKANYYVLKTLLRMGNSTSYESLMNLASMNSLEQRRYEHSLILAFKSNRLQGPLYISNIPKVRSSHHNLRNSGQNFEQAGYNTLYLQNSFTYIVSHTWNELLSHIKKSLSTFRNSIVPNLDLTNKRNLGCKCMQRCT